MALFAGSAVLVVDQLVSPLDELLATRTEAGDSSLHMQQRRASYQKRLFDGGECLTYQVQTPKVPYPAWDHNWDGRGVVAMTTLDDSSNRSTAVVVGKTRHILLVRHGQYEQGFPEDSEQILTPLGRRQAELTGQRLAKMMAVNSNIGSEGKESVTFSGPCRIKAIHVSGMARAKETASIIAAQLRNDKICVTEPDPLLNEALPAPIIPGRPDVGPLFDQEREINENHDRIETAFQKYIHRADPSDDGEDDSWDHEFELVVGHANVIRYFLLRALQLPPEAWLRLSLFNCSITYLIVQPNGYVTARLVGDTGHIPYEETTFSGAYGYNWKAPTST